MLLLGDGSWSSVQRLKWWCRGKLLFGLTVAHPHGPTSTQKKDDQHKKAGYGSDDDTDESSVADICVNQSNSNDNRIQY